MPIIVIDTTMVLSNKLKKFVEEVDRLGIFEIVLFTNHREASNYAKLHQFELSLYLLEVEFNADLGIIDKLKELEGGTKFIVVEDKGADINFQKNLALKMFTLKNSYHISQISYQLLGVLFETTVNSCVLDYRDHFQNFGSTYLNTNDILFMQSSVKKKNIVEIVLRNGMKEIRSSLKSLENLSSNFLFSSHSFIVNIKNVSKIDVRERTIYFVSSERTAHLSRRKMGEVLSLLKLKDKTRQDKTRQDKTRQDKTL